MRVMADVESGDPIERGFGDQQFVTGRRMVEYDDVVAR